MTDPDALNARVMNMFDKLRRRMVLISGFRKSLSIGCANHKMRELGKKAAGTGLQR